MVEEGTYWIKNRCVNDDTIKMKKERFEYEKNNNDFYKCEFYYEYLWM